MDLGLYLHVPFCRAKCAWCAFASRSCPSDPDAGPWLTQILTTLEAGPFPGTTEGPRWATAYLGGGTPTVLAPGDLDTLLAAVGRRLVPGAEVTVEANPESLTAAHLEVFAARGVTRLSLGVQSFQDDLLARHGRPTRRVHLDAARRLLEAWPGDLSLDLIAGLGGQTEAGQAADLDEALAWNPAHLSFYALSVEPGTPLARWAAQGRAGLPPDDVAVRWWLEGRDRIAAAGLPAYEVSNFARPGHESRHNGRYWALEPWWGLGPSAASFLPRPGGGFEYRTEAASLDRWLAGAPAAVEVPTPLETAKDRLLAGLRRVSGVPEGPWQTLVPRTLEAWKARLGRAQGRLFLTGEAFLVQDAFLRQAFSELDGRPEFR